MKIVFLCGSVEPGCDGVGDYTRVLAAQMIKQGHTASIISLNDYHVSELLEEKQDADEVSLSVFRIPSGWKENKRFRCAKTIIHDCKPDWLSLQFVIYSFHPKGLSFRLAKNFSSLANGIRWHIMFHEVWVGFTKISPVKHKITGYFQSKIISSVVRELKPDAVSTTNVLYQLVLNQIDVTATILPLFSNIPFAQINESFKTDFFKKLSIDKGSSANWKFVGIFGNLYPDAQLEEIMNEQLRLAGAENKKLAFVAFGKNNGAGRTEYKRLEKIFSGNVKFLDFGEQPSENISHLLQLLHAGISCTPSQHIGKSGVFAAMKLHGVEVILPKGDVIPEYHTQIKQYHDEIVNRPSSAWSASHVSKHFTQLLKN